MQVRANLVVPVLNNTRLWGLLVAHYCQDIRSWTSSNIEEMQKAAKILATAASIQDS
jgi:GAF domain-containing protein